MALAALVLTGGLVTLWGWVGLDAGRHSLRDGASGPGGRLVDWFGDGISMKANAAVTAAALAGAVLLGQLRRGRLARWIALALAVGAGAIGAATLLQHVAGWELGIDGLLAKEFPGARATSAPGRMGLPASTSFTLVGAAAAVAIWRRATASPALLRRSGRLAVGLTVIVCIIASASLLGHLYGADTMFAIPGLTGIAVQTASMLLALGVAVLCTLEDRSPVRVLVDPGTGGLLARRAIAVVVLLPVVLGHLRTLGERAGYFDAPTGRALLILSLIGLLLWLLFGSAAVIRRREQRALAAERAGDVRYRMLFNSIDQGFCIVEVDFEGERPVDYRFLEVNAAFERQTGLRHAQGRTIRELAPTLEQHWFDTYGAVARTGVPVRFENRADALGRIYDVYAFRLAEQGEGDQSEGGRDGRPGRVAVLFSDITERRRDEEALKAHRERLEELVKERTQELERSQGNLRRAERLAAIGTLAAGLGHDLANLLLPMRIRLESLGRGPLSEAAREDVAGLKEGLEYMKRLSAGLRQLAADPDAPPPVQGTDLNEWWHEAQGMLKAVLPRHVKLVSGLGEAQGLPPVAVSRVSLTQAVFNLVQNAGEALSSRAEGVVTVAAMNRGDQVAITVSDDGPGMTPEVAARCFDPYFSTKGRGVSTGMGLPLVRGMIESVGGSVQVRSAPGAGAEFTVTLPAVVKRAEGAGGRAGVRSERGDVAVAMSVVEPRRRALVSSVLRELGVRVVESTAEAAVWVTDERPIQELKAFRGGSPHRVVVVMAEAGDAGVNGEEGIVRAGRNPAAAELRRSIMAAVAAVPVQSPANA